MFYLFIYFLHFYHDSFWTASWTRQEIRICGGFLASAESLTLTLQCRPLPQGSSLRSQPPAVSLPERPQLPPNPHSTPSLTPVHCSPRSLKAELRWTPSSRGGRHLPRVRGQGKKTLESITGLNKFPRDMQGLVWWVWEAGRSWDMEP